MITDAGFGFSWDAQTKSHFNRSTTFNYIFDYRGRNTDSVYPEWMGRCWGRVTVAHISWVYAVEHVESREWSMF